MAPRINSGMPRSDMFSLGVMTCQMLTGRLPYGVQVAKARSMSAQAKLIYDSVLDAALRYGGEAGFLLDHYRG